MDLSKEILSLGDSGVKCYGWYLVMKDGYWVPSPRSSYTVFALTSDFFADEPSVWGLPIHPQAVKAIRSLPPRDLYVGTADLCDPPLSLYHGTSEDALFSIWRDGFRLPSCKKLDACRRQCKCHMMGRCIYFAGFQKAERYAKESSFWKKIERGGIVRCAVYLGRWKVQPKLPCQCCGKPYVDHEGNWMKGNFWDCLMIDADSLPATRVPEWCHRRPSWIVCLDVRQYRDGKIVDSEENAKEVKGSEKTPKP